MADTPTPAAAAVEAVKAATTPAETAVKTEAPPTAADPKLEAFARKERQLHKMRKELEAERASLKTKLSEYETGYIPKQRLNEDPFGVLGELGLDYNKLTEMLLNSPNMNDPTIRALMQKVKSIEDRQSQAQKQSEEAAQKQYADALKQIGSEIKLLVASSADFEMIKETGMEEAVLELIEQTYNSEGSLMDIGDACKQVEEHLLVEAEKIARTKKLQSRLAPKAEAIAPDAKSPQAQITKTLTNAVSNTPSKRLSNKERIERAKLAFYGKL